MRIKGFNIFIVIFAFALSLVGGMALERVMGTYTVDKPLQQMLKEIEGVQTYEVEKDAGKTNLIIQLHDVDDLQRTYKELYRVSAKLLGKRLGTIRISDNRDSTLNQLYYKIHYGLYEAATRGNFGTMDVMVRDALAPYNEIAYKLSVDNSRIYFQMECNEKYVYEIIPRSTRVDTVNLETRGESWW
jgi:hypothetical protein